MKIGFIGLGKMGSPMARNLIKAGHDVTVFDRSGSQAGEFRSLGAKIAAVPSDAASGAEVFINMLPDDIAVESVIFGPGNIVNHLPGGAADGQPHT